MRLEVISLGDFVSHASHLCMNGDSVLSCTLRESKKKMETFMGEGE